jgi:translation initiation factor 1
MSRLVYSTDQGRLCPDCNMPIDACRCAELAEQSRLKQSDGVVRIRRETKGRKGKGVSIVSGLPLATDDLKKLAKELKQKLSTGGAIREGDLEFQGDVREALKKLLEDRGYTVKLSGG